MLHNRIFARTEIAHPPIARPDIQMPDEEPGRTYVHLDRLGWAYSRLAFLRIFLACAAFALGLAATSSNFATAPTLLLILSIALLVAANRADSFWPSFFGLQLLAAIGLWKLGYIVIQFRETPPLDVDWAGMALALLALALVAELACGFVVSFTCGPREALYLREDVGLFSFVRGLFGAPSGFAIVTGYKLLPTFLFAASLVLALWLGEILFALLIWKPSAERIPPSILTAAALVASVYVLRQLAKRASPESATAILERDHRAPVVFLRAFSDDRVEMNLPSLVFFDRILSLAISPRNLDQLLVLEFSTYGPVVAVGDPKSPVRTFGVYRDFLGDGGQWQDYVRTNAVFATAIIVVPDFAKDGTDLSDGVKWELRLLRDLGLLGKTLILAPKKHRQLPQNIRFWTRVAETLSIDFPKNSDKPCLGVYFEEIDQCVLLSSKFRTDSYRLALRHFFRFKRYRPFAF